MFPLNEFIDYSSGVFLLNRCEAAALHSPRLFYRPEEVFLLVTNKVQTHLV